MSEQNSTGANENDLDAAVAIANQYANTILLALRTVHEIHRAQGRVARNQTKRTRNACMGCLALDRLVSK
jgi:hypothetical protein